MDVPCLPFKKNTYTKMKKEHFELLVLEFKLIDLNRTAVDYEVYDMKNLSLDSLVYGWNMYIADNDIDDMSKEEKEIVLAAEKILKFFLKSAREITFAEVSNFCFLISFLPVAISTSPSLSTSTSSS